MPRSFCWKATEAWLLSFAVEPPYGLAGAIPQPVWGAAKRRHPMPVVRPVNQFLTAMDDVSFSRIAPHLRLVTLSAGESLYEPGDRVEALYFPETGLLSAVTPLASGQSVDVASRGRDGAVGYIEAAGSGEMAARITVQISGQAHCLPASAYLSAYGASAALRRMVFLRMELLLVESRQAVACQAFHTTLQRLAKLLLDCRQHTGSRTFQVTQEFIASMVGAGRPRINRAARDLQGAGLIRYSRGRVEILDEVGLHRVSCECYDVVRGSWDRLTTHEAVRDA